MELLKSIILIIFGILQIILFFKIWGMTNNIKAIKKKYLDSDPDNDGTSPQRDSSKFNIGDLVVEIKTDRQMRIKEITKDGKLSCYINGGTTHVGNFSENEIRQF